MLSTRRVTDLLMHGYVVIWLLIFGLPFLALLQYSMQKGRGYDPLGNYSYVFLGTFKENLLLSLEVTVSAIVLEVPNRPIGEGTVRAWATASLVGHAPEVQVSRWGLPMITHIQTSASIGAADLR